MSPGNPYASSTKGASPTDYRSPADELEPYRATPRVPSDVARKLIFSLGPAGMIVASMGAFFFVLGFVVSSFVAAQLPSDIALDLFAKETRGYVLSNEVDAHVKVGGRHPYLVEIEYRVDGVTYVASTSTSLGALAKHAAVDVEYLSFAPSIARAKGTTRQVGGYVAGVVCIWPIVGALMLVIPFVARRRRRRAFVYGIPTYGKVTFYGPDRKTKINGRHPTMITWRFNDAQGHSFDGKLSSLQTTLLGERPIGGPIVVLYDPRNPRANTIWC